MGVDPSVIPIVYTVINVAHTIIGIPAGVLADKIGKEKVLIIGYAVFAVTSLLMALLAGSSMYSYVLALAFGLYLGILETVQRAVISKYVSAELCGISYGLYNLVSGVCFFVSNMTFGYIWDIYGVNLAVLFSLCFSFSSIAGMSVFIISYSNIKPI